MFRFIVAQIAVSVAADNRFGPIDRQFNQKEHPGHGKPQPGQHQRGQTTGRQRAKPLTTSRQSHGLQRAESHGRRDHWLSHISEFDEQIPGTDD
jgi:hypothetical protein